MNLYGSEGVEIVYWTGLGRQH